MKSIDAPHSGGMSRVAKPHTAELGQTRWSKLCSLLVLLLLIASLPLAWGQESLGASQDPPINGASKNRTDAGPQQIVTVVKRLSLQDSALSVAWSPDGNHLATLSHFWQRVTLWDPHTGKKIWERMRDIAGGEALAFSDDGRFLLTPTAKAGPEDDHVAVTLWDVTTGSIVRGVADPTRSVIESRTSREHSLWIERMS
jgi:hypothetical protein